MNDIQFTWNASLSAVDAKLTEGVMTISGELINTSVCANKWAIDPLEMPKLTEQVHLVSLRVDHSKSARDVIGGLKKGTYDEKNQRIMFEAEIDDPIIQRSVAKGRLKYVSIGASADAFCSACGKLTKPLKTCRCRDSHDIIRNVKLKEVSIVTDPAFEKSEFQPVSFSASLTSALNKLELDQVSTDSAKAEGGVHDKKMEERKMSENKEIVEATTAKPAGPDAVVLLGEKMEQIMANMAKLEARFKKQDEDEAKRKKDEDERKKSEDEESKKKKEGEIATKLESIMTKLEKFECKPPEEAKKEAKKQPPEEEEDEEDEKKPPEKTKKETPAAPVKGAKVESPDGSTEVTADTKVAWWREIVAFAEKSGVLD